MSEQKEPTYGTLRMRMHEDRVKTTPWDTDPDNIKDVIEWILEHYTLVEKEGFEYDEVVEVLPSTGCTMRNVMFDNFIVCNDTVCKYCERVDGLKGKQQLLCNRPDSSGCIRNGKPIG